MNANLQRAIDLLHRYGNVGRSPDDLLRTPPSEAELSAAVAKAHGEVDFAAATIRDHFKRTALDDKVDAWHEGDGKGKSLQEYLGMSDDEFVAFVKGG